MDSPSSSLLASSKEDGAHHHRLPGRRAERSNGLYDFKRALCAKLGDRFPSLRYEARRSSGSQTFFDRCGISGQHRHQQPEMRPHPIWSSIPRPSAFGHVIFVEPLRLLCRIVRVPDQRQQHQLIQDKMPRRGGFPSPMWQGQEGILTGSTKPARRSKALRRLYIGRRRRRQTTALKGICLSLKFSPPQGDQDAAGQVASSCQPVLRRVSRLSCGRITWGRRPTWWNTFKTLGKHSNAFSEERRRTG